MRALYIGSVLAVVIVGITLVPYIRDVVVSVQVTGDTYTRYALTPKSVLIERLDRAETELARVRYQSVLYQHVIDTNAALASEVKYISDKTYGSAHVVAVPPRTHYDTLVIAAGSNDSVAIRDTVLVEGIALGTVTSVSPHAAVVELYTSPGRETDIELGSPHGTVVMHGLGGGSAEATVPDTVLVTQGDAVTDTKTGLVIGTVTTVTKRPTDTSATVRIALPVSLSSLTLVTLQHE